MMKKRKPRKKNDRQPTVRWHGINEAPPPGKAGKRYFRLDTLARAVERRLERGQTFMHTCIRGNLGPADLATLDFTLAAESSYKLVFHMRATNARRKSADFALVTAKNDTACSALLQAEQGHLRSLFSRARAYAAQPLRSGDFYLPDRYRRSDRGREVFAHLTAWPGPVSAICPASDGQLRTGGPKRQRLSKKETETLRAMICRCITQAYDPEARTGIDLAELTPDDFGILRGRRGKPKLFLLSCRRMRPHLSPLRFTEALMTAAWHGEAGEFYLLPEDPEAFTTLFAEAAGPKTASIWIRDFMKAVDKGKAAAPPVHYLDALEQIVLK